ncbi:MAG: hypothetical protein GXO43_00350 [Crenarchaeota archaeon]|nr:hypothetical protein [Thermoproteota archaeon]
MNSRFSSCIRRSIRHVLFIPLFLFILIILAAVLFVLSGSGTAISVSPVFLLVSMIVYMFFITLFLRVYNYAKTVLDTEVSCDIISLGKLTFIYIITIIIPLIYPIKENLSYVIDAYITITAIIIQLHYASILSRISYLVASTYGTKEEETSGFLSYKFRNVGLLRGFTVLGIILVLALFISLRFFTGGVSYDYIVFIVVLTIFFLVMSGIISIRYKITNDPYRGLRFASLYRMFTIINMLAILIFYGVATASTRKMYEIIDPYAVSFLVETVAAMFILVYLKYSLDDLVGLIIVSKVPRIAKEAGMLPIYMIIHDIPVMDSISKVSHAFNDILRSIWFAGFPINTVIYISKPYSLLRTMLLFNFNETFDEVKEEITSLGEDFEKVVGPPEAYIFNIAYPTAETLPRPPKHYFNLKVHERSITFERIYLIRSIMSIIRKSRGVLLIIEDLSDLINISSFTTVYSLVRSLLSLLRPNVDAMIIITPKYRPHEQYINVFKNIANNVVDVTRLLI